MAKVAFSKLNLSIDKSVKEVEFNSQKIEVIQYLPFEDKLKLLETIINNSGDGNGFYSSPKVDLYIYLETIFAYANLNITDKQKENLPKLYDLFVSSGLGDLIIEAIPEDERDWIADQAYDTIDRIYEYRNSVYGILDAMATDYKDLDLDATKIQEKLANGENVEFLKEVMTKLD